MRMRRFRCSAARPGPGTGTSRQELYAQAVCLPMFSNNILASLTIMQESTENYKYVNFIVYNPHLDPLHNAGKPVKYDSHFFISFFFRRSTVSSYGI